MEFGKIIWLTSYPKSGNTWVRFLLYNLIFGKPETATEVEQLMPDIHFSLSKRNDISIDDILCCDSVIVKTHFTLDFLKTRLPLLYQETAGFIYVIRHPLDVMISNLDYQNLSLFGQNQDLDLERESKYYVDEFIANLGSKRWRDIGFGNLIAHESSWLNSQNEFPHIVVQYETLMSDVEAELKKMADFVGLDVEKSDLSEAVCNSSFSQMKKLEDKAIKEKEKGMFYDETYEISHKLGLRFINKGRVGQGQERLSSKQIESANKNFESLMKKYGYV